MRPVDYARLLLLAAIWGSSFIFMRVLAPALGVFATADLRVLLAGLLLLAWFRVIGFDAAWRSRWRHYVAIGLLNSGVPFSLYCFAALHLPAAYSAIINSLSPLFGAVFAALWLGEALTPSKLLGLALGISGVALVAWRGGAPSDPWFLWAVLACVGATICYGLGGIYIKKFAPAIPPLANAGCSQLAAGLLLLPLVAFAPPAPAAFTIPILLNLLGLAVLCSAVAYILYYRLMTDVGPTRALTVTFLVPGFGMLWGLLFLGESIRLPMLLGFALILAGTLTVGGTLRSLLSGAAVKS